MKGKEREGVNCYFVEGHWVGDLGSGPRDGDGEGASIACIELPCEARYRKNPC